MSIGMILNGTEIESGGGPFGGGDFKFYLPMLTSLMYNITKFTTGLWISVIMSLSKRWPWLGLSWVFTGQDGTQRGRGEHCN